MGANIATMAASSASIPNGISQSSSTSKSSTTEESISKLQILPDDVPDEPCPCSCSAPINQNCNATNEVDPTNMVRSFVYPV